MKKIYLAFGICFVFIAICMGYLVKNGISLRSAPLIRPALISEDKKNISHAVVLRLAPEFQSADYILWGIGPETPQSTELIENMRHEYERVFKRPIQILDQKVTSQTGEALAQAVRECKFPCWILLPREQAHELQLNEFVSTHIRPGKHPYINITWLTYSRDVAVPTECENQKHLKLECIAPLSVRETKKKMKAKGPHFFLRKYMDRDYFLLTEVM